jgi:hypothetical protein
MVAQHDRTIPHECRGAHAACLRMAGDIRVHVQRLPAQNQARAVLCGSRGSASACLHPMGTVGVHSVASSLGSMPIGLSPSGRTGWRPVQWVLPVPGHQSPPSSQALAASGDRLPKARRPGPDRPRCSSTCEDDTAEAGHRLIRGRREDVQIPLSAALGCQALAKRSLIHACSISTFGKSG